MYITQQIFFDILIVIFFAFNRFSFHSLFKFVFDEINNVNYIIFYRNVIKMIRFLINYEFFAKHFTYIQIRNYNIDNSENLNVININKRIYNEMHMID